jgi:predicted nuclease of predicted toxin-antitoxin system
LATPDGNSPAGESESIQLEFVRREERVIMTHDADFLHIASTTDDHPGGVYCGKSARLVGEIIRGLILMYEVLTLEEMRGQVEYL